MGQNQYLKLSEADRNRHDATQVMEQDINTCPRCGGFADNGFSREIPPSPYVCRACEAADEIDSLRQQLAAAEAAMQEVGGAVESNKAVERALKDVDYRGTYADGVEYLKQQLASVAKERDEIKAQAMMLDRMVDERDDQLAAALVAIEAKDAVIEYLWAIIDDIDTYGDMAKSDDKAFRALVERRQKDRWKTGITTDGFTLTIPIKPDASILKAHDEALIERCADLADSYDIFIGEAIRELKGEK